MPRRTTTNTSTARTPSSVFVDTGGWISVTSADDDLHSVGRRYYEGLVRSRARLSTSDYVLDETITRLRYDFGHATAMEFLRYIEAAEAAGSLTVLAVDRRVWREAASVFAQYDDQDFSFTDCTSFVLARETAADEVFTFDHHFRILGFLIGPTAPTR